MFLATTTAANGGVMSTGMLIMWLVIMFGMMYFLMIRPQKKEQKKLERKKSMREARVDITTRAVRQELDVRGMALDEAIPEVEKFIDDAMLSSLGEVSIIHGNGTGVLRAGIQDCLRRHPCVSSFRLGRYGEGETGVTIVSLK